MPLPSSSKRHKPIARGHQKRSRNSWLKPQHSRRWSRQRLKRLRRKLRPKLLKLNVLRLIRRPNARTRLLLRPRQHVRRPQSQPQQFQHPQYPLQARNRRKSSVSTDTTQTPCTAAWVSPPSPHSWSWTWMTKHSYTWRYLPAPYGKPKPSPGC